MLNELQVGEFLAALGERTPAPASGAATALTGALAAALAELAARFAGDEDAVIHARALQAMLEQIVRNAKARYPNLAIAYVSSRTRCYTNNPTLLNPSRSPTKPVGPPSG